MSKHNATSWETIDVSDGSKMRLFMAAPDSQPEKSPAIIVFQEGEYYGHQAISPLDL